MEVSNFQSLLLIIFILFLSTSYCQDPSYYEELEYEDNDEYEEYEEYVESDTGDSTTPSGASNSTSSESSKSDNSTSVPFSTRITNATVHAVNQINHIFENVNRLNISGIVDNALLIHTSPPVRRLVNTIMDAVFCNAFLKSYNNCAGTGVNATEDPLLLTNLRTPRPS